MMVDDYVSALSSRLRGPRGAKADLLTETRDSLTDAVESHLARGLDPESAQRKAVEEFGSVGTIAREYQAELAMSSGTRTLVTLALVMPVMHMLWELNRWFWVGAWSPHNMAPPPEWYIWIAKANDMVGGAAAGLAVVALVFGRYLCRGNTSSLTMGRLAGGLAVLSVLAALLGQGAIMTATWVVDVRMLLLSPAVSVASAISFVVTVWLGVLARRCLRCATIST